MGERDMYKVSVKMILAVLVLWAADSFAKEYYVQSAQAPLWRMPSFAAEKLVLVPQGAKVEVLDVQQGWLSVQYNNHNGWMLKLMLSVQPPARSKVADQQAIQLMEDRSRMRPSAYASTAAARGLMTKGDGFGNKLSTDFGAVAVMESYRVTRQEALDFIAKGKTYEKNK